MSDRPRHAQFHILVVEDNPADVQLLRWCCTGAGLSCEWTVIDDGAKAITFIRQQEENPSDSAPDLAILDLNLPKYDGLEVLEAMRAGSKFAELPVAILSSSSSPRERAKMEAFHIKRYITKPVDLDEYRTIGLIVKDLLVKAKSAGVSA